MRGIKIGLKQDSHYISGVDTETGGAGVLEWCYGEMDAADMLRKMQAHPARFSRLRMCTNEEY